MPRGARQEIGGTGPRRQSMAAVRDEAQEQEFTELIGFLADPKAEVQRLAAEGVLAQTESQDFVAFCQEKPRAPAKQLLRLVERAEADAIAKLSSVKEGTRDQVMRAKRLAEKEAELSLAAGAAALQALVNLSAVPAVRDELVELSAPRRCGDALRSGWLDGRSALAHYYSMLLANLSTAKQGQKAICENEELLRFLFSAFVAKPRPPPRDGCEDPMGYLGKALGNVCALPEGRALLAVGDQGIATLTQLATELRDRGRRTDVLNCIRNLCLDEDCHEVIVKTAIAPVMTLFLYPWDKVSADQRAQLPEQLREALQADGAAMTTDVSVRGLAAECFLGLSRTEAGREYISSFGLVEVLRAWLQEEPEEENKTVIDAVLQACGASADAPGQ